MGTNNAKCLLDAAYAICIHSTANEKAWVLMSEWVSEGACLLLTQVKTRDSTASKKYFIFSLKICPPDLSLCTALWESGWVRQSNSTTCMLLLYEWRLYKEEWGFSAFVAKFQKSVKASCWMKLTRDNSLWTQSTVQSSECFTDISRAPDCWPPGPRRPCPVSTGVLL